VTVTTAIIGVGNLGSALARHLVGGDEPIVLAAKDDSHAEAVLQEIGPLARAASGVDAALRIEMPGGDLHQMGLNGELLDLDRAREVLATTEVTA
jgi:F420-dependent NADP oxidoreductase-like protein